MNKETLSRRIVSAMKIYLKSQFILMIIVSLIFWIILSLLHIRFALLLGVASGVFSTVPFIGLIIIAVIASLVAVFDGYQSLPVSPIIEGIIVFLIYIITHQFIDWLLSPFIVGKTVKIHPLILLAAIIAGTSFFGIIGTLLAVPVTIIIKETWEYYTEKKNNK